MIRWAGLCLTITAYAETFTIAPLIIRQGETLRLQSSGVTATARLNGRIVRMFPEATGGSFGLMPVPALEQPGKYLVEFLDSTGVVVHSSSVTVRDARFPAQNVVISKEAAELKPSPDEMETVAAFRRAVSDIRHWTDPFAPPVAGCRTSPFGVQRLHNGKRTGNFHAGVDQRSAAGTPIRAISGGVVKIVRQWNVHGGTVAIDHGQGLGSIYLHMSRFATTEGAEVHKGDIVGYVGSTGRSTAPHLHWSLYANGVPVNPGQWIRIQGCGTGKSLKQPLSDSRRSTRRHTQ